MIISTLNIKPISEKQQVVLRILHSLIGSTQAETGCICCRLYQHLENKKLITYVEEWQNESDMIRHIRSERYRKILAAMDFAGELPDLRFQTFSNLRTAPPTLA